MIKDILKEVEAIDARIAALSAEGAEPDEADALLGREGASADLAELESRRARLLEGCAELTPADRVFLARHQGRPRIDEYINELFTDFFEQRGDRQCREDESILGGIAR